MPPAPRSPRRREVLDELRAAPAPLGVTEVAERIGVHPNTVRFHLDALVAEGLIERQLEEPAGPGRPRTVYAPQPGMDRGGTRSYRLLAQILLSHLASTGPDNAHQAAIEAGRAWGRFLIDPVPPYHRPTAEESAVRLTALLDDLGFSPTPEGGGDGEAPERIRLRHCPFLELAQEHGQLVCSVHLGLMQGALAELRAPMAASHLEPFAEPDSCLAHLAPAPPASSATA
ncbi:helix-turn-helix transcriptional regulator [Streptomyces turgidiscabies]|uniref:helix-turn-helix transcriptional regulator n=1 Tax=Streptomyces TaxID=1883 RepID=UPI00224DD73D|nr:helix-turn-helix domain-containing protein [Streptomyces sp. NBC_00847]MCX4884856.1 helix-turn-helix domain-containing protein [Streptomyces sp. NBC_00847]